MAAAAAAAQKAGMEVMAIRLKNARFPWGTCLAGIDSSVAGSKEKAPAPPPP
jgi:hypothetical protein